MMFWSGQSAGQVGDTSLLERIRVWRPLKERLQRKGGSTPSSEQNPGCVAGL